jgi:23S rRNA (pseudouridine1915-N3)-methyltransferase
MRVTLAAVGRARKGPEAQLFEDYWTRAARLGPRLGFTSFSVNLVDLSQCPSPEARRREEGEKLLRRIPAGFYRIVLDERGRSLSSEEFAKKLLSVRDNGAGDIAFVIGGPVGLSADLLASAAQSMAFGAQTWPHLLVRAMLAEQIYRALTILSGHPYHRA